jgi:hypothetical protein
MNRIENPYWFIHLLNVARFDLRRIDEASSCWIFVVIILTDFYIVPGDTCHVIEMLWTGITSAIQKVMGITACLRMDAENVAKL